MEPAPMGIAEWSQVGNALAWLWAVVIFVILFAANMIVGHNLIPSFVASRHIPQSWQRVRVAFYAAAVICFAIAVVSAARAIDQAGVLQKVWPNFWI